MRFAVFLPLLPLLLLLCGAAAAAAFFPSAATAFSAGIRAQQLSSFGYHATAEPREEEEPSPSAGDDDEEEGSNFNPYADPNYPDLEFVNYDDPEYQSGVGDPDEQLFDSTEEEIEAMREERRLRNDEFQFQTYWSSILKEGKSQFKGEWTKYLTNTFLMVENDNGGGGGSGSSDDSLPKLIVSDPITVSSRGYKEDTSEKDEVMQYSGRERIRHVEHVESPMGNDAELDVFGMTDDDNAYDSVDLQAYWPESLQPFDFRGEQGIMVCGNAWTIGTAVPLVADQAANVGPFSEYRSEVGIQAEDMRFRVKFDYSVLPDYETSSSAAAAAAAPPPLHLKSMTVCREALDKWPRNNEKASELLFGAPGALGGLYDPPPVGDPTKYMMVDLDGGATVLFPAVLDQAKDDDDDSSGGWVTSLDWTAGQMRYQVDRKVHGGPNLMGLRTLELSEVQGADAEQYRPRDGGEDMRQ